MRPYTVTVVILALAWQLATLADSSLAQQRSRRPRRSTTVPPPDWDESVQGVFFANARDQLGPGSPGRRSVQRSDPDGGSGTGDTPAATGFGWSKLILATTIEDEIKNLSRPLTEATATPGKFKAGAFRDARRDYSVLAVMFGIVNDYDGDIRFRQAAPGMRDGLARAAKNCKVATDGSYNESRRRSEDLALLIRGGKPELPLPRADVTWADVADLPPLMQRMEIAYRDRLKKWTGSRGEFKARVDAIRHEAQLLAAFSEVLKDEAYDYADDETYLEYVSALQESSAELLRALQASDLAAVQSAVGAIHKSCDNCHGDFR